MTLQEARLFVASFIKGDYTPEGYATFLQWLEKASIDDLGMIADEHEALFEQWPIPVAGPSKEWIMKLEQKLDQVDVQQGEKAPVRKLEGGRVMKRMVGVAAAAVLVAAGVYMWRSQRAGQETGINAGQNQPKNQQGVLSKIFSVPRGGQQQQFVLPDGSKVWLNAASTLSYPATFTGKDRMMELSGEAFFEVSKNAVLPFRVKIKGAEIDVLGTRFNVKAYEDEPVSRTTLIDGSVKVIRGAEVVVLQPGDQAEMSFSPKDGSPMKVVQVNVDDIMAWKTGMIKFRDADLRAVMQQVARCYDLALEFEGNVPEDKRYSGSLSRNSTIKEILNQLEHQQIHCKIMDGKTIVVMH